MRGGAHHVPLPRRRMDLGIVHPIPLAVHDVVAQFHVLDDLGQCQRSGAQPPQPAAMATQERDAADDLQRAAPGWCAAGTLHRGRRGRTRSHGAASPAAPSASTSASLRCEYSRMSVIAIVRPIMRVPAATCPSPRCGGTLGRLGRTSGPGLLRRRRGANGRPVSTTPTQTGDRRAQWRGVRSPDQPLRPGVCRIIGLEP